MEVCVQHTRPSIKVISEAFRKEQTTSVMLQLIMREDIHERECVKSLDLFQNGGEGVGCNSLLCFSDCYFLARFEKFQNSFGSKGKGGGISPWDAFPGRGNELSVYRR